MTYGPRMIRALFALDTILKPLGLVLITTVDGEPGGEMRVTRARLQRRGSFVPDRW